MNQMKRRNRSSRIVTPVCCVSSVETWMIDRGMSGAVTESCNATFLVLPATK